MPRDNIDFDAIRSGYPIDAVIAQRVDLTRRGNEYVGLCPFHDEHTPSFTVFNDRFHCFGCGAKGDVVDFIAKTHHVSLPRAVEILTGDTQPLPPRAEPTPRAPDFVQSDPPPDAPLPDFAGARRIYAYRNASAQIVRYILRWETERVKRFGARTWGTIDGITGWHPRQATHRGLYGLELLAQDRAAPVLVVEGEKACDAARTLFPGFVVVTWSGGGNAVHKTDWTPLHGRRVVIWPDNDAPGLTAAQAVAGLTGGAILDVSDLPHAADAADIEPPADPAAWIEARLPPPAGDEPPPPIPPDDALPPTDAQPEGVIPLGHDHGTYFYYSIASRQVWPLRPEQHTQANFSGMASVAYHWSRQIQHTDSKGHIQWPSIADWLMTACRRVGIYDPLRVRGRGAWIEGQSVVVHLGDRLVVDGEPTPLNARETDFIYEAAPILLKSLAAPATTRDAHQLFKISQMLRWERGVDATLFAGWLALAPICGALDWRPSVWLTAASGAGKSWVVTNIIVPTLNGFALHVGANTTEAFLRQSLGSDALPVIFDEAEREGPKSAAMMQDVLHLVRQSSSETGGVIGKGGQAGKPTSYRIRSAFCFQSINVALVSRADESRITVLSLRAASNPNDVPFEDIVTTVAERLTPAACAAIVARSISLIPVIRHNAEIFAAAIERHQGSRRLGDQIGTLLAGAYSLHASTRISPERADEYVAKQSWISPEIEAERDENKLLQRLLETKLRINPLEIPVATLISAVCENDPDSPVSSAVALRELGAIGIRPLLIGDQWGIAVANSHTALQRILAATPWDGSWQRALSRLEGSKSGRDLAPVRFGPRSRLRAVWVPLSADD